jgi:hypothetical protein
MATSVFLYGTNGEVPNAHLALLIFGELGWKSPFLTTDLESLRCSIACDG